MEWGANGCRSFGYRCKRRSAEKDVDDKRDEKASRGRVRNSSPIGHVRAPRRQGPERPLRLARVSRRSGELTASPGCARRRRHPSPRRHPVCDTTVQGLGLADFCTKTRGEAGHWIRLFPLDFSALLPRPGGGGGSRRGSACLLSISSPSAADQFFFFIGFDDKSRLRLGHQGVVCAHPVTF